MKRLITVLAMFFTAASSFGAGVPWLTDLPTALAQAKREDKYVLLNFTGSDWCSWCIKLKGEVFDQPAFATFVQENLVVVEVDFPHNKPQDAKLKKANQDLARTYGVDAYPTVLILNAAGQLIAKTGYMPGGPAAFIANLEKIPGMKRAPLPQAKEEEPEAPRKPVEFVPIAPAVPTHYGQLALKGISGPKDKRMALINNQTFVAGETAKVKVRDSRIGLLCKEIREDSVVIVIDGKEQELKLGKSQ